MAPRTARRSGGIRQRGRDAHPGVDLPEDALREAIERHSLPGVGEDRVPDLYLATACAAGVDGSWEALQAGAFPALGAFLQRRGASREEADAIVADLPGYLIQRSADGEGPPRIGTFAARSRLSTWLAVVAWRLLMERRRVRGGPSPAPLPGEARDPKAFPPLREVVGRESAGILEDALHQAWGRLTPKECLAVLLRYRDGLPQTRIARLMGVGEPRVSRLLRAGVERLREEVRRELRETPPRGGTSGGLAWEALQKALAERMAESAPPPPPRG